VRRLRTWFQRFLFRRQDRPSHHDHQHRRHGLPFENAVDVREDLKSEQIGDMKIHYEKAMEQVAEVALDQVARDQLAGPSTNYPIARSTTAISSGERLPSLDFNRCLLTVAIWSAIAFRGSPFRTIAASHGYSRDMLLVTGTT
jgi:hypothetical protein